MESYLTSRRLSLISKLKSFIGMQQEAFVVQDYEQKLFVDKPPQRLRRVTIEVTTWCNLDCTGCLRTIESKQGKWQSRHMSVETFSKIVNNLPSAGSVTLHGIGEPTMHPNFIELVKIARASGKFAQLHCNTNAMARVPEFYSELVESGLSSFSVSVDSLTPSIVAATRSGTDVEKLYSRIQEFKQRRLPFGIQMVVGKLNLGDIFDTLSKLNEVGELLVIIQPYINLDDRDFALTKVTAAEFLAKIENSKKQLNNLNIIVGGMRNLGIDSSPLNIPLCTSPWLDPAINVDGFLTPCCVHINPTTLGNINLAECSFNEAWSSNSMQKFISEYVRTPPLFCNGCSENVRSDQFDASIAKKREVVVSHGSLLVKQKSTSEVLANAKALVMAGEVDKGLGLIRDRLIDTEEGAEYVGDAVYDVAYVSVGMYEELLARYKIAWDKEIWPKKDLRQYAEYKHSIGMPPIFICTLPKSGSLYISEMIDKNLGMPVVRISLDLFPEDYLIPEMVRFLASGGASSWGHVDASERNIKILEDEGLHKFVMHLRDPRQVAVSFVHHVESNLVKENSFYKWRFIPRLPEWNEKTPFSEKMDWYIENRFAKKMGWINNWLFAGRNSKKLNILFTHFENFRTHEQEYLEQIYDFFDVPHKVREFTIPDVKGNFHFRSGEMDEWRRVCTIEQQERMWQLIGNDLAKEMSWHE